MRSITSLLCLAAATFAVGCGDAPRLAHTSVAPAAERGVTVRAVTSQYGTILANGAGKAFYLFDKERAGRSECYGACASAWPPVLTKGRPIAGRGIRRGLLGTTRRRDGSLQVTYRGRPMYYYVADAPGRVLCHDVFEFGGRWLVVQPSGRPVV
jgi:predicted lipoprotein with Yx(FWY)xxD motif